jgi:hypothetical protein
MNLKKVALLILLSTTAFPMVTPAKPHQDNPVIYPMKQRSASRFFVRVLTLGLKGR